MSPPPEMRTPTLAEVGGAEVSKGLATFNYQKPAPTAMVDVDQEHVLDDLVVLAAAGDVVAAVRMARRCLTDAQFRLDDEGLECDLLDRLQGGAAVLLSVWQGRTVPPPAVPDHIAASAIQYRRERERRLRR